MDNPVLTLPRAVQIPNNYNTRHLGGFILDEGRTVSEKLIRSGKTIEFTEEDIDILVNLYNLKTVVDFRTPEEAEDEPSLINIPGVEYLNMSMFGDSIPGTGDLIKVDTIVRNAVLRIREDPRDLIEFFHYLGGTIQGVIDFYNNIYYEIVATDVSQKVMGQFFDLILEKSSGSTFFHCKGGKDRTGVVAAFYLRALGIDWETCIEDLLLTNEYYLVGGLDEVLAEVMEITNDPLVVEGTKLICMADERFLVQAQDYVIGQYGSLDNYLLEALSLTEEKKKTLRDLYTL